MATEIGKQIGMRIKEAREQRGLTQAQLADMLGKSVETISNFERGKVLTSLLTLDRIAELLDVPTKTFLDFGEGMDRPQRPLSRHAMTVKNAADLLPDDDLEIVAGLIEVLETRRRRKQDAS